jgi:AAA15 family ATPase/GTPase
MLKRIRIKGYKSLVDVEVELQPLSVLFGPSQPYFGQRSDR